MPGTTASGAPSPSETWSLLDVQLDVGGGQLGPSAMRKRLPAHPRSSSRKTTTPRPGEPEPLDRLDPGDDAERPVEAAAGGDGVEVRARSRPRGRSGHAADQVPGVVDLELETRLA